VSSAQTRMPNSFNKIPETHIERTSRGERLPNQYKRGALGWR